MASIDVGGSERSGKKAVDSPIPLIPFIDLLLCCVMFLLVTAVWNQLASHDAVQQVPGENADQPAPEVLRFVLQITHDGYVLSSTAGDHIELPKAEGRYDRVALGERLAILRQSDPNAHGLTLAADDGVAYDDVVQAMDVAAAHGFAQLALSEI